MTPDPKNFPVTIEIPIQWGDHDALGHVNNIHFLRWFESARIEYLRRCNARISNDGIGPILAAVDCNYRRQLRFPDSAIISAAVQKIGNSSITIEHYLWSEKQGVLAADGHSVVVMFDYTIQQSVPVSDDIREAIQLIESN